jgi:hypothetical protein
MNVHREQRNKHIVAEITARRVKLEVIGQRYGITRQAIHYIGARYGVFRTRSGRVVDPWTSWSDADIRFLRHHYRKPGWSARRIADELGRTRNEVIGKANRMGLTSPKRAEGLPPASRNRPASHASKQGASA